MTGAAAGHVSTPTTWTPTSLPARDAAGGVAQINGVYALLEGVRQGRDNLMGGFQYLERQPDGITHEGIDLNSLGPGDADLGAAVVAPLDGVVTFVGHWDGVSRGFGTHLALWIDDVRASAPCFLHAAHLSRVAVWAGQRVTAGQLLAECGKSGRQPYAHVHVALWHQVPPGGWGFWQTGKTRAWVAAHTLAPEQWFWASVARAGALAKAEPPASPTTLPEEGLMLLSDWQLAHWILPPLFTAAGIDYNPDAATSKAWITELRAGRYRGRPRSGEEPYGEGADVGLRVEWEGGVLLYRVSDGAVSWEG